MISKSLLPWVKRCLFLLALLPLSRLFWLGFTDQLGANPVEFVEHSTGTWALVILLLTLTVTPLHRVPGWGWLVTLRRMLGLFMCFYASLHVLAYIWLDHWFEWSAIIQDIAKHPYVLVGFLAFICTIPLAVTSTDGMMRRLGKRWKTLHSLVYLIAILAVLHYLWLVKQDISQPLGYTLILAGLLFFRLHRKLKNKI